MATLGAKQLDSWWGGSGSPWLSHIARLVSPVLRCVVPIRRAHFFLCKTSHPPCCALPSVHLGLFLGQLLCQG